MTAPANAVGECRAGLMELIGEAGIGPASKSAVGLARYLELLLKWNARLNLTGSSRWEGLAPLFQEAVAAARFYRDGTVRHLDIGSGAGFPAVPLKILRPRMRLHLLESRMRRAVFLETVAAELGLNETRVVGSRVEEYLSGEGRAETWDCISWKALKLSTKTVERIVSHGSEKAEFWLFHGRTLPVEDEGAFDALFELKRREPHPTKRDWYLSIYERRRMLAC